MFNLPLKVIRLAEGYVNNVHILQVTLSEINPDERIDIEEVRLQLMIRTEKSVNPEEGFQRNRFKLHDIWNLSFQEEKT